MREWLRLVRFPAVFTALADVAMGFLFVRPSLSPLVSFLALGVTTICHYAAGMIWNDVCDIDQDRRERPDRPLPSGRIGMAAAHRAGAMLLIAGVAAGWFASWTLWTAGTEAAWRPGLVATILPLVILAYDAWLKRTPWGPWAMGACRGLNVLLGMSANGILVTKASSGPAPWFLGVDTSGWVVVAGYSLYIVGVTQFARGEADRVVRSRLALGLVGIVLGLVILGLFPRTGAFATGQRGLALADPMVWPILIALLTFTIVRRCMVAIRTSRIDLVQSAVGHALRSTIVLNAAICLAVRPPIAWSLLILSLLIPMLLIGRRMYIT